MRKVGSSIDPSASSSITVAAYVDDPNQLRLPVTFTIVHRIGARVGWLERGKGGEAPKTKEGRRGQIERRARTQRLDLEGMGGDRGRPGGRRGSRRSYRRERRRWLGRHLLIQRFSRTRVGGVSTHSGASSPVRYRTESTNVHRFTTMRSFITTAKDGRVSHGSGRRHRLRQLVNHIASDQGRVPAGPLRTAWSGHGPGGSDGSPVRGPPCALRAHFIGVLRRASTGRGFAPNAWRDRVRLG
jgi:hypothetical protein